MSDKLHFEILIDSTPKEVYQKMLDDKTYRQWTEPFTPGSYYEGSWEKNARFRFLGPNPEEGKPSGMVSEIEENIPAKFVSIKHLGIIKDGKEITEGPEVDNWKGAHENYTLEKVGDKTKVLIDMDSNDEMEEFLMDSWPKALNKLKEICEN